MYNNGNSYFNRIRIVLLVIILINTLFIHQINCFINNSKNRLYKYHFNLQDTSIDTMPIVTTFGKRNIGTTLDNALTLVLNADYKPLSYMPLSIWNWQDSLRAVLSDKAFVVSEFDDIQVRSVSKQYGLPSVIVLKKYSARPDKVPVMSRRNVYYRDNFCCQYCATSFAKNQKLLSLDHVVPRSLGGKLTWMNTVTACNSCNFKKGHTLPEDLPRIGMKLKNAPRIPSYSELQYKAKQYSKSTMHPHWDHFI